MHAMDSLHKAKNYLKLYQVWYKLNSQPELQVNTGAGITALGLVGLVTGHGEVEQH